MRELVLLTGQQGAAEDSRTTHAINGPKYTKGVIHLWAITTFKREKKLKFWGHFFNQTSRFQCAELDEVEKVEKNPAPPPLPPSLPPPRPLLLPPPPPPAEAKASLIDTDFPPHPRRPTSLHHHGGTLGRSLAMSSCLASGSDASTRSSSFVR